MIVSSKNRDKNFRVLAFFAILLIFVVIFFCISKNFSQNKIDIILKSEAYEYLSTDVKKYIEDVYKETGSILLTEKNKVDNVPYLNPLYAEYLDYLSKVELGEITMSEIQEIFEVIPSETVIDYIDLANINTFTESEIPSSFDLRDVGGKNFVTPVKDQGGTGLCWSFATNAQAESFLLKKNNQSYEEGVSQIFSEMQIDYAYADNGIIDGTPLYNTSRNLGDGGNFEYATAVMSNGLGLVDVSWRSFEEYDYKPLEKNVVYKFENSKYDVLSTVDYPRLNWNELDLTKEEDIAKRESYLNDLKKLIMENGGAYVATADPSGYCSFAINGERFIYDDDVCSSASHAMQVIGWDDNYEYSFCSNLQNEKKYYYISSDITTCPAEDVVTGKGAWLLKNSWGSSHSYVHLAYDSKGWQSMGSSFNLITGMEERDWDNYYTMTKEASKYLYDKSTDVIEKLNKIKLHVSAQDNTYEILIGSDADNLISYGTIDIQFPGIYTVDLSDENIIIDGDLIVKINAETGAAYADKVELFTDNSDDSIEMITEDVIYEPRLTNIDKYIFRITSSSINIPENTIVEYNILNQQNELISFNYSYSENMVFANQVFSYLEVDNTLEHGTYTLQTIVNNEVIDDSLIVVNEENVVVKGSGDADDPYIINTPRQLDLIRVNRFAYYKLGQDIDLTYDTQNENGLFYNDGKGWEPINYSDYQRMSKDGYLSFSKGFSGGFDGDNHKIIGLYINRPDEDGVGLFSNTYNENFSNLYIKNLNIVEPDVTGNAFVGSLVGYVHGTTHERQLNISNIQVHGGTISGNDYVGGIAGHLNVGSWLKEYLSPEDKQNLKVRHFISNLYNSASVNSNGYAGGLVGLLTIIEGYGEGKNPATLYNLLNKGKVTSGGKSGGLVGYAKARDINDITIVDSINTGIVSGENHSNQILGEFSAESEGNLYLNNIYYLNDNPEFADETIIVNNIGKKSIADIKNSNNYTEWSGFSDNWKIETVDGISRIPMLNFVDFKYTSMTDIKIGVDQQLNIYDFISPNIDIAKNIQYEVADSVIATISDDGTIVGKSVGETTIHIVSYYDGYEANVDLSVFEDRSTITFNSNGGTEVAAIKDYPGNKITSPIEPNKKYYAFDGWYTDNETFENKYVFDVMPDDNITLYAKWNRIESTISFDTCGGSTIESITNYAGEKVEVPADPVKENYNFDGWYLDNLTFKEKYEFDVMPEDDIVLYAKWISLIVEVDDYVVNNDIVSDVTINTSIDSYINKFNYDRSLTVNFYNFKGELVNDQSLMVGTNSKIMFYDKDVLVDEYTNVVRADITGDGLADLADLSKMFNHYRGNITMTGVYFLAGDVTGDDNVDLSDLSKYYNYYRGNIDEI